jgi:uncharacterized protein (TIGR03663 family)
LLGWAVVLSVAAWLRLADLGGKPVHADESVHAWKVGEMLDGGAHRYDPHEYHGPTLHYLGSIAARLCGETSSGELTIATLRLVPAATGIALVAAALLLAPMLGARASLFAGAWTAVSPLQVYYSRHFIQEPLVVLTTLLSVSLGWMAIRRSSWRFALAAGCAFGLLVATKETWLLVAAAAVPAIALASWPHRHALWRPDVLRNRLREIVAFTASTVFVTALFYSAFFTDWDGLVDFVKGLVIGAGRSSGGVHDKPWWYYVQFFVWNPTGGRNWTEGTILVFALASLLLSRRRPRARPSVEASGRIFWLVYAGALAAAYSIVPYKIVWLALGFWHAAAVAAGAGTALAFRRTTRTVPRWVLAGIVVAMLVHLGRNAHHAAVRAPAHPRNPYAYVTTSSDALRLAPRLDAIAAVSPRGRELRIHVALEEYWPLPWLLRGFPNVGYWLGVPDTWSTADVYLVSPEVFATMPPELADSLATEFFGLRDGTLVVLAAPRDLWSASLPPPSSAP